MARHHDNDDDYNCFEEIAFWFEPSSGEKGEWQWQYTLYTLGTPQEMLMRRLGQLSLQNPRVGTNHLHRALIHDQTLGAFIPNPKAWIEAGKGEDAGFFIKQKQRLGRAQYIAEKASRART